MNRNYQKELDRIIQKRGKRMPRVLLHSCCGPCSSSVLEYLTQYFDVTLLWYNPNIYPKEEFDRRFKTQVQLIESMGLADKVSVLAEPWKSADYYARIKGLENEPEGGKRCAECFRLRLLETARLAKHYQYDYFCTTLTLSRHKDAVLINGIGEEIGRAVGVSWLPSDFKKRDGENRSIELSEKYGLYRQLYCGCEFSLHRREETATRMAKNSEDSNEENSNTYTRNSRGRRRMLRRAHNDTLPDKLCRGAVPRIRGAVHTAVFHALHRVGAVRRLHHRKSA